VVKTGHSLGRYEDLRRPKFMVSYLRHFNLGKTCQAYSFNGKSLAISFCGCISIFFKLNVRMILAYMCKFLKPQIV
jgi:hypothetical protein